MLLFGLTAFGQGVNYGLKISKNFSHFYGNYVATAEEEIRVTLDPKFSSRFSGGGFVRYYVTQRFSIQTELLYTTRGVRFNEDVEIRNREMQISGGLMMKYIEVPVLFRFGTWLPKPEPPQYHPPGYTYHAFTGFSVGYHATTRFSGDLSGDLFGVDFNEPFSGRVEDQFNDTDVSLIIGAGIEYGRLSKFTFDIRYIVSLLDIGTDPAFSGDIRHGAISASIGVLF